MSYRNVSIDDYYRSYRCPAKLLIKLVGFKLKRPSYKKPKISPTKIGIIGERLVFDSMVGNIDVKKPEYALPDVDGTKVSYDEYLKWLFSLPRSEIKLSLEYFLNEILKIKKKVMNELVLRLNTKEHPISKSLKEKYNLDFIIPQTKIYNVAYHYRGEIDFIGVTKRGDVKIIEVKNAARVDPKALIQVSLYMHSMNKRFIAGVNFFEKTSLILTNIEKTMLGNHRELRKPLFIDFLVAELYKKNKHLLREFLVDRVTASALEKELVER